MEIIDVLEAMTAYDAGDPARIHHFLKVWAFASAIGQREGLDPETQLRLETAALVHDIGIHPSLEKYGSAAGKYQELEGPGEARLLLEGLGAPAELTERVCFLVGHHHTYEGISGSDYRILVEADFLVNLHESGASREAALSAGERIFRTEAGKRFLRRLYLAEPELTIRMLAPGDERWDAVREYAQNCSWRAGPQLAKAMAEGGFRDYERVFAALDGERVAGYCTLAKTDCVPEAAYMPYIGYMFVGEAYRGHRVSGKLIEAALDYAKSLGFERVYLVSGEKGLYEKYGFQKLEERMASYGKPAQIFVREV